MEICNYHLFLMADAVDTEHRPFQPQRLIRRRRCSRTNRKNTLYVHVLMVSIERTDELVQNGVLDELADFLRHLVILLELFLLVLVNGNVAVVEPHQHLFFFRSSFILRNGGQRVTKLYTACGQRVLL